MAGINALPRVYKYSDEQRAAWRAQYAGETIPPEKLAAIFKDRGARTPAERKAANDKLEADRMAAMKAKPYTGSNKNVFGKQGTIAEQVNKQIDQQRKELAAKPKKGPTLGQIKAAVRAGKNLHAETPSTCLASLTYNGKDQVAVAEFYRGGAITYEYDMTVEEFLDWAQSGSLGKYGNENVF